MGAVNEVRVEQHPLQNDHSNSGLKIDPAFVVSPEFRPDRRHDEYTDAFEGESVPLLDFSFLRGPPSYQISEKGGDLDYELKKKSLIEEVGRARREWGFFQVINHGVESQLLNNLEAEIKEFFALSLEENKRVARSVENPTVGYFDSELTKNVRDWKEVFDFVHGSVEMPL